MSPASGDVNQQDATPANELPFPLNRCHQRVVTIINTNDTEYVF